MKNTPTINMLSIILSIALCMSLNGCERAATEQSKSAIDEHENGAQIIPQRLVIDPQAAQAAGITIAVAGPVVLRETLALYGTVQPNAERVRNVVARFPGVVKSVSKTLGERVAIGDVLATVESNDSLQTYALKAPIAGVITARNINAGESVAEQTLFTLTDLSNVWVELALFARDMPQVHIGQTVAISAVDGGPTGNGRIVWMAALGSAATQSLAARALLDNRQNQWTPGLYVAGVIAVAEHPAALAVANTALQTLDGKTVVFVEEGGAYSARTVQTGRSDATHSEIVAGLEPGARYVELNSFVLKAESEKSSAEHAH